jgi:D-glycero-D-manno-heptose 1,7-bisphosphate phosphatase
MLPTFPGFLSPDMTAALPRRGLLVLDRDGVINRDSAEFVKTPDEWLPLPGSIEAISALSRAGFAIAVATNQSGLGRGLIDEATLAAMHDKFRGLVSEAGGQVDLIVYCPHHPDDDCDCRKPKPGLFEQIAEHFQTGVDGVPAIGDSLRDLEAAAAAGASPILVRTGNGARTEAALSGELACIPVFDDLAGAALHLLSDS